MKYLQASIFHLRLNYDSDLPQMAWADLSHRPISDVDSSDYICLVPAEVQKTNCCLENLKSSLNLLPQVQMSPNFVHMLNQRP